MTVAARPGFSASPHPVATASAEHVWQLSAGRIAELVRAGEMSALEVVEAHIARIEDVNPHLNAVVVKRYDAARSEAREIDRRRLAGDDQGLHRRCGPSLDLRTALAGEQHCRCG